MAPAPTIPPPIRHVEGDQTQVLRQMSRVLGQPALRAVCIAGAGGAVEIKVCNLAGEPCRGRFVVLLWSVSGDGAPTALAGLTFTAGVNLSTVESDAVWLGRTGDDGLLSVVMSGTGERAIEAVVIGGAVEASRTASL